MELTFTLSTIHAAAAEFLRHFKDKKVFAFNGTMGAGKTTFIHALCDVLQVSGAVSSPTFSIINQYISPSGTIFHLDLYRLKDAEDAMQAGVEDCLYSDSFCLVEWPERASSLLPPDAVQVYLNVINEQTRSVSTQ